MPKNRLYQLGCVVLISLAPAAATADPPGEPKDECGWLDDGTRGGWLEEVDRKLGVLDGVELTFRAATCFQGADYYLGKVWVEWTVDGVARRSVLSHSQTGTTAAGWFQPLLVGRSLHLDYPCGNRRADEGQTCHEVWQWRGPKAGFAAGPRSVSSPYAQRIARWRAHLSAGRIEAAYREPPASSPNGGHTNLGAEHLLEFAGAVHRTAHDAYHRGDHPEAARLARFVVEKPPSWEMIWTLEDEDFVVCLGGRGRPDGPPTDQWKQSCGLRPSIFVPNRAEWASILTDLAFFVLEDGDARLAEPLLEQVNENWPQYTAAHLNRADALVALGNISGARQSYTRYVEARGRAGKSVPARVTRWLAEHPAAD